MSTMTTELLAREKAAFNQMVYDLVNISQLGVESVTAISTSILGLKGLVVRETVMSAVQECLQSSEEECDSDDVTDCIFRALVSIDPDRIPEVIASFQQWVSVSKTRTARFNEEAVPQLKRNLDILILDYPALNLMLRAEALLREVGDELQDVEFVPDMRPIFYKNGKAVEEFVFVANLKLNYITQTGTRHSCGIVLTEDELVHLRNKADEALQRLSVLKQINRASLIGIDLESSI